MLQQSTLLFIRDIKDNNNKPWFEANRNVYEAAKADFEQMMAKVIEQYGKKDEEIAMLEPKKCIYRINRDIRFSKDKTPYKAHMGASIERGGRNSGFAGYYFHCEPGNNSLAGGGIWMPEASALKKVRQEIDYCWSEFKDIIADKKFVAQYGDLDKAEYTLSREPKGYEKDNPAIEYLKLKSFVATRHFTDEELLSPDLVKKIVAAFDALKPLIMFINRSLHE